MRALRAKLNIWQTLPSTIVWVRAFSGVIGLLLGLYYARYLGPLNRAALTSIFLLNYFFSSIYLNSHNLEFKSKVQFGEQNEPIARLTNSISKIFAYSILQTIFFSVYLLRYFDTEAHLIVLSFLYSVVVGLNYQIGILLLDTTRFRDYALREMLLIFIQLVLLGCFTQLTNIGGVTVILSVLTLSNLFFLAFFFLTEPRDKLLYFYQIALPQRLRRILKVGTESFKANFDVATNISIIYSLKVLIMFSFAPELFSPFILLYSLFSLPLTLSDGVTQLLLVRSSISRSTLRKYIISILSTEFAIGLSLLKWPKLVTSIVGNGWQFDSRTICASLGLTLAQTCYHFVFLQISHSIVGHKRIFHMLCVMGLPNLGVILLIVFDEKSILNFTFTYIAGYSSFVIYTILQERKKYRKYRVVANET